MFSQSQMNHFLIVSFMALCLWLGTLGSAIANYCVEPAVVEEVADGVFVRPGVHGVPFEGEDFANVGFIVGDKCVAVIDSGTSVLEGDALNCAIREVTSLPICYLILSHHHFDHVMGNLAFRDLRQSDQAEIIAHEKLEPSFAQSAEYYRTELAESPEQPLPQDHVVFPDLAVKTDETLSLDLGGRELLVYAHPAAHTDNDLSIIDSKTSTLWLSDLLFVEHVPTLDSSLGSLNGWLDELDKLMAMDAAIAIAIPGHGPASVEWPAGAQDMYRYLSTVRDETREVIASNGSINRAQEEVGLAEADKWEMFDFHHRRTVIRAFTELEWE